MEATQQRRILKILEARDNQFETPEAYALADVFREYAPDIQADWMEASSEAEIMNISSGVRSWELQASILMSALATAFRSTLHWFEGVENKKELVLNSLRAQIISTMPVHSRYNTTQAYHYSIATCEKMVDFCEDNKLQIKPGEQPNHDSHWVFVEDSCRNLANQFRHLRDGANEHNPNIIVYILQTVGFINNNLHSLQWRLQVPHSGMKYQVVKK